MANLGRFGLLFAGLSSLAGLAPAQTLFGVTGRAGVESLLYTINTTTGATTLVGDTGFTGVGAMAFGTNGTTLYGVAGNANGSSPGHFLITINTITGAGTKVSNNQTGAGNIADIAVRSDGVLFATGGQGNLYTISTTTGVATLVGNLPDASEGNALAFNAIGTLYLCAGATLYTVNTTTAATTQLEQLDTDDDFDGMKFQPGTGTLFLSDSSGGIATVTSFAGISPTNFGSLNTSVVLEALAFGTPSSPPPSTTPIPSTLLLLGAALAMVAFWHFARKRARTA